MSNVLPRLHATTVNIDGKGVLIIGPSGSGKSALALELMSRGALLVADDMTCIEKRGSQVWASVPDTIVGQIEARGVGILTVPTAGPTLLGMVVDMGKEVQQRLPEPQVHIVEGASFPCLHHSRHAHFATAVLFYAKAVTGHACVES